MKKYILFFTKLFLLLPILVFNLSKAQNTLFQEDFEAIAPGGLGTWQAGYFGTLAIFPYNAFYVQSACPANLIGGTRSMQITGITSPTTAVCDYQNNSNIYNTNYAALIYHQVNASNFNNITLSYKWKCNGEISGTPRDYGRLMYSLDGNTWTVITNFLRNGNNDTVTVSNFVLPTALSNTSFYIGWSFVADGSVVNNPGLTIDDISIKGTAICGAVNATASKFVVCAGESTTLSATSTSTGYTYTWYTNWDNATHTGTLVGTGASITVNPAISTLYGVVATKTGCPTGVNAAYDLITVAVTPAPTLVVLDPISAITCSNEFREINVVSGGNIPNDALYENWDPIKNPWTTNTLVAAGGNATNALWYLYASGGIASPDNSNFAMVNSDAVGPYAMESSLLSAPISLLDYNTPITLGFNHFYSTYNLPPSFYSSATVEISEDDGANWTVLKTYTGSTVGSATNFAQESIDLNAYAGKSFLLLRFHYMGRYDDVWAVDDIKITGSPKPTTITWSPTSGLFTNALGTIPYTGGNTTQVYASPSTTTTYIVNAKTAVGCPSSTTVTVERGDKNWSGGNTNWNTPGNWSEGTIPTANHCVNIPSTAQKAIITVGTDAFAKNLTIRSGAGLTIDGSLTVTNFVKNEASAADLVISSDASLKQITDNPVPANLGSATAKRDIKLSLGRQQYNYVISPLENQSLASIYKDALGNPVLVPFVLYHNESTNRFYNSSGAYIKGRGLAVKEPAAAYTPSTMTARFSGALTNGAFTFGIISSNPDPLVPTYGYNLTGNPYPSNIDLRKLYNINGGNTDSNPQGDSPNISATFYFWDNTVNTIYEQQGNGYLGQSYAIFNVLPGINGTGTQAGSLSGSITGIKRPTKIVIVGQGFMTRSLKSTYDLNFNNSIRTTETSAVDFLGKESSTIEDDRYWLKMTAPSGIISNVAIVHYPGGNNLFGPEDSRSMGGSDALYNLVENEKVAINGRSSFNVTDIVPLGTAHFGSGSYQIGLDAKEGIFANGQNIYLKDRETGIVTNLSSGTYTFAANAGETSGRFEIIYEPQTVLVTDSATKEDLVIFRDGQDFVLKAQSKKIDKVEVYDTNGRLIYTLQPHATITKINSELLVTGVYILKIDQGGTISVKKIIK